MSVELPLNSEKKPHLILICKYTAILVDKNILPIFIIIKPDNYLHIKLNANTSKEKIENLLNNIVCNWFSNVKIVNIEYTE
jgi:hypothetical protein